jgi:hypothetical protein
MGISRAGVGRVVSRRGGFAHSGATRCRRKFLRFFPKGFEDQKYVDWERGYKWSAHEQWEQELNQRTHSLLLKQEKFEEIAARAVRIESRTNLLFSFEKMALRDGVRSREGARSFAEGLHAFLYGADELENRFERWCEVVAILPRKQTRVLTWPVVTIFGFLAQPESHIFLKPKVTRTAAEEYEFPFHYDTVPSWPTYKSFLDFAGAVSADQRDLRPRDQIDIQSFLWVQGSDEYAE